MELDIKEDDITNNISQSSIKFTEQESSRINKNNSESIFDKASFILFGIVSLFSWTAIITQTTV